MVTHAQEERHLLRSERRKQTQSHGFVKDRTKGFCTVGKGNRNVQIARFAYDQRTERSIVDSMHQPQRQNIQILQVNPKRKRDIEESKGD